MNAKHNKDAGLSDPVQLLFSALPFSLLASLINGVILVYIQRSVIEYEILLNWFIFLVLVSLFRGIIFILYNESLVWPASHGRWYQLNLLGVVLSSIVWGGAGILLFPSDSVAHQAFLGFIIAGMSAGALSTLSYSRTAVLVFLTVVLLPLIFSFFSIANEFGITMGTMVLLYYFIISSTALNTHKSYMKNVSLLTRTQAQQKALQQSEDKYQAIFNSAPLGILHYKLDGSITSENLMALDLLEIRKQGLRDINLLKDVGDEQFVSAIKSSLQGEHGQYTGSTNVIFSYSNKPVRMYCRGISDESDNIIGGVAILEDVTEEQRVNQLKNEFVSTVSHELRTPLTAIHGATGLLKSAKNNLDEAQVDSLVGNISRNSERLIQLVNDILDVEKITTGKMEFHFEKLSVLTLLKQAAADNQAYADKYNVKIDMVSDSVDSDIMVDKNRFLQVMANLLSNAAKFTRENTQVRVGTMMENKRIRVYVKDYGEGISSDFKDKIFEKFTQQDASDTRAVGGTGLGLTISKEIVEKMNGEMGFDSEKGAGSVFYFDLPSV